MTTIKIYSSSESESFIEVSNINYMIPDEITLMVDHPNCKSLLYFQLEKEDAKELILYLKKQFNL